MGSGVEDLLGQISRDIIEYLPNLLAALLLVAAGLGAGWFVKRVVIQLCSLLKLHRFFRRFRWGAALLKADVRIAFFEFVGNACFAVVFLVFLSNALSVMRLEVLSRVLEGGILLLPRILGALVVFGFGWLISGWTAAAVQKALRKERVPRPTLAARLARAMLLLFFSGMALAELGIASEIVVAGFTVFFVAFAALIVVLAALSGREIMRRVLEEEKE